MADQRGSFGIEIDKPSIVQLNDNLGLEYRGNSQKKNQANHIRVEQLRHQNNFL